MRDTAASQTDGETETVVHHHGNRLTCGPSPWQPSHRCNWMTAAVQPVNSVCQREHHYSTPDDYLHKHAAEQRCDDASESICCPSQSSGLLRTNTDPSSDKHHQIFKG